ncbi:cysteine alpha-hairpin motif superfamily [Amylocarpus encephaloides]|uniref:Cysteine alpha-hairpin motif superfamily n=1 Tax=Amylocarpus encephaloides TaxID=45428 RepID=A0A9P7YNU6_9HELO|nr:cysteine alpha-hairpin motif superfamily [Amylocarpus encephaloides]
MADKKREDGPWDQKTSQKFEGKQLSEYYDPCQEAADRSLKCLHRNGGDRDMCSDYFQAYRDCKKQWVSAAFLVLSRIAERSSHHAFEFHAAEACMS